MNELDVLLNIGISLPIAGIMFLLFLVLKDTLFDKKVTKN